MATDTSTRVSISATGPLGTAYRVEGIGGGPLGQVVYVYRGTTPYSCGCLDYVHTGDCRHIAAVKSLNLKVS